jgi:hypothetical protein
MDNYLQDGFYAQRATCNFKYNQSFFKNEITEDDIKLYNLEKEIIYCKNEVDYIRAFIENIKERVIKKCKNLSSVKIILSTFDKNNIIHATNTGTGTGSWSPKLQADFANFEKTHNPNFQFDMNIIQKQASPEEVEYLIKNNKWPWSNSVKAMYKDAIMRNSTISMDPGVAMDVAQTIYNETAVKEMLSWNSKEGAFLLTGATVGHTKGLPDNINNIVRCGLPDGVNGNAVMEKITNVGYNGINGSMTKNYAPVPDSEIPKLVAGFKFLKGECNPCLALNSPPDYSCPFSLNVGDGGEVSSIWKDLWGLVSGSGSGSSSSGSKKKEFPILNELKNELNKASSMLNFSSNENVIVEDAVSPPEALHNDDSVESPFLNSNM